jgi:hypothetical protein
MKPRAIAFGSNLCNLLAARTGLLKNGDRVMEELLGALHPIISRIRHLQAVIYHLGPGILNRYTIECAWLICLLCLGAAGIDVLRGRRFDALLWVCMAGLLSTAFWLQIRNPASNSGYFALAAVTIGLLLLLRSLRQLFLNGAKVEESPAPGQSA